MRLVGGQALIKTIQKQVKDLEKEIGLKRREIARFLIEAMLQRTPVWSGDTAGSYFVSNGGGSSGRKHTHKPNERGTNFMPLGKRAEKYAGAAWAKSLATTTGVDYSLERPVHVMNDSDIWADIDSGLLPKGRARNPGGVSDIALMRTKNKFKGILK